MFHTSHNAELPYPPELQQPGVSSWQYVWHDTYLPWLHISFIIKRPNAETTNRVLMTPRVGDLLKLTNDSSIELLEVNLATPGSINKSGRWKLDFLHSIWIKETKACCYAYMLDNDEFVSERPYDEAKISEYMVIWEQSKKS